ncbi:MAG: hypothetical protein KJN87_08355 [Desulfofustis sp.]|nr:hypothetical protein [Desulfofustis sp.]
MNRAEKTYSLMAIGYIAGLACVLMTSPAAWEIKYLLPLSLLGVAVNVGLLFVIYKDIFSRSFSSPWQKYFWLLLIFLCMPAVLIYLPMYGFRNQ